MKTYYNIEDKQFFTITNFEYTPKENEIEVDNDTYNEIKEKRKNHYKATIEVVNGKLKVSYTLNEAKKKEAELNKLRSKREPLLRAFDIYKTNLSYGIFSESEVDHNLIVNWYKDLLDLKESAFDNVPLLISKYE